MLLPRSRSSGRGDVLGDTFVGDTFVGDGGEPDVGGVCGRGLKDCLAKLYMLSGVALGSSCLEVRSGCGW